MTTQRSFTWLPLLLLLMLPLVVQAQFNYTANGVAVTITGYTGPGGAVSIPSTINGLPVTSIGYEAFDWCTTITSLTIPNSVTSIGGAAFWNCCSLTSITIPNSVTSIGDSVFGYCLSLTAITVDALNSSYCSVDGVLFNKSQTALIQCPSLKAGSYTIPGSVTSLWAEAFFYCASLTSITIPNSITSIGQDTFYCCTSLSSVTIPNSVTGIGRSSFQSCTSLTNATIGSGVTGIGDFAFYGCPLLTGVYFLGNAPSADSTVFQGDHATVHYLVGTTGWGPTFGGCPTTPTALWPQPGILTSPLTQTAEANSAVSLEVKASGSSPLFWLWYFNYTNLLSWGTNDWLHLTNVQFAQAGAYTAIITNVAGAVTSSAALLQVIAPVERRLAPMVRLMGEVGSSFNVDCADSLSPTPRWTTLGSMSLTSTSQYYFDVTVPLPPQGFYQAWRTGTSGVRRSLDLHMVPIITLTGNIGASVRLDYINRVGPIDAWVTLNRVTLTNTSQLYIDTSAWGQPQRLYRPVP